MIRPVAGALQSVVNGLNDRTIKTVITVKMIETVKKELFERIIRIRPDLSPKKRRVADFMMEDYKRLFLMSAKEIARRCQVSEPTITRFVMDLGFSGFGEFEQYLKALLRIELTSVDRFLKTGATADQSGTLNEFHQNTIMNLENMLNSISERELIELAQKLFAAKKIMVAGYKLSAALAIYFGYLLKKIKSGILIDTVFAGDNLDSIALSDDEMVLFVIAFPRYPTRAVELVEYAKKYKTRIICLTDSLKCPLVNHCEAFILIDMEGHSFVDPFAHIIAFLGALIHEIAQIDKPGTAARLSRIEEGVHRRQDFFLEEDTESARSNPLGIYNHRNAKTG